MGGGGVPACHLFQMQMQLIWEEAGAAQVGGVPWSQMVNSPKGHIQGLRLYPNVDVTEKPDGSMGDR